VQVIVVGYGFRFLGPQVVGSNPPASTRTSTKGAMMLALSNFYDQSSFASLLTPFYPYIG
jgi:hypothetical protein